MLCLERTCSWRKTGNLYFSLLAIFLSSIAVSEVSRCNIRLLVSVFHLRLRELLVLSPYCTPCYFSLARVYPGLVSISCVFSPLSWCSLYFRPVF
jgi:hypothetical protein